MGLRTRVEKLVYSASRRPRHIFILSAVGVVSVALLYAAYFIHDNYVQQLLINLGAGLLATFAVIAILDPLLKQIKDAETKEHPRLNLELVTTRILHSRRWVRVLETWTALLDDGYRENFMEALLRAAQAGAVVEILLLSPSSKGAEQRALELGKVRDVERLIMRDLHILGKFMRDSASPRVRNRIAIRVYAASPSFGLYQTDDLVFLSFFPLGKPNTNEPQIESHVNTPWGLFVLDRFEELWEDPTTLSLERYQKRPLIFENSSTGSATELQVEYLERGSRLFISGRPLLRQAGATGIANCRVDMGDGKGLRRVSSPDLNRAVLDAFQWKYGREPDVVYEVLDGAVG